MPTSQGPPGEVLSFGTEGFERLAGSSLSPETSQVLPLSPGVLTMAANPAWQVHRGLSSCTTWHHPSSGCLGRGTSATAQDGRPGIVWVSLPQLFTYITSFPHQSNPRCPMEEAEGRRGEEVRAGAWVPGCSACWSQWELSSRISWRADLLEVVCPWRALGHGCWLTRD